MDFLCTLQWLGATKGSVLSKAVLEVHKANFFLKSQKREQDTQGNIFIHISAQTRGKEKIKDLEQSLSTLNDFKLVNVMPGSSLDLLSTKLDRKSTLDKIAHSYPDIVQVVNTYACGLSDSERAEEIFSLGKTVGGGVYKRDYSLGSPLAIPATLSRELVPALKVFGKAKHSDTRISLQDNPFCTTSSMCCEFIAGFIYGFLDKNPAAEMKDVVKLACAKDGAAECIYDVK